MLWQILIVILVSSVPSIAGELVHPSGQIQRHWSSNSNQMSLRVLKAKLARLYPNQNHCFAWKAALQFSNQSFWVCVLHIYLVGLSKNHKSELNHAAITHGSIAHIFIQKEEAAQCSLTATASSCRLMQLKKHFWASKAFFGLSGKNVFFNIKKH